MHINASLSSMKYVSKLRFIDSYEANRMYFTSYKVVKTLILNSLYLIKFILYLFNNANYVYKFKTFRV